VHGQPVFFKEPSTARVYGAVVPVQRTAEGARTARRRTRPAVNVLATGLKRDRRCMCRAAENAHTSRERAREKEERGRPGGREAGNQGDREAGQERTT